VANAIYVWGIAQALGGRVLLRMEDHDRGRSRPEYQGAILDDLKWLGLVPDVGAGELRGGTSLYRQSDCDELHRGALTALVRSGRVYGCDCSRKGSAEASIDR
jgi:glutamyl/glutaminyl-tRNA synthetase